MKMKLSINYELLPVTTRAVSVIYIYSLKIEVSLTFFMNDITLVGNILTAFLPLVFSLIENGYSVRIPCVFKVQLIMHPPCWTLRIRNVCFVLLDGKPL